MKKGYVLLILLATFILIGCENDGNNENIIVSKENMIRTVEDLTSEKYAGRLTGTNGNYLTAEYLHQKFDGIRKSSNQDLYNYSQEYTQPSKMMEETPTLKVLDAFGDEIHAFRYIDDFMVLTSQGQKFSGSLNGEIVFVENLEDINVDFTNKLFVIKDVVFDTLLNEDDFMAFLESEDLAGLVLVSTTSKNSHFAVSPFILPDTNEELSNEGPFVINVFEDAYPILEDAKEQDFTLQVESSFYVEEVIAENILYVIEGKTDEVLLFGAHYDHVGDNMDGTYNPGALDNASGVSVVLELARLLSLSKEQPEKTIVFALFNGEEQYLYGSRYYVNNPLYSLEKTTMINIDTVGSKLDIPLQIEGYHGKDSALISLIATEANHLGLEWEAGQSTMTDHAPFAEKGCEVINLIHPDFEHGYHSYSDTADNIDEDKLVEVVNLLLRYLEENTYKTLSIG